MKTKAPPCVHEWTSAAEQPLYTCTVQYHEPNEQIDAKIAIRNVNGWKHEACAQRKIQCEPASTVQADMTTSESFYQYITNKDYGTERIKGTSTVQCTENI